MKALFLSILFWRSIVKVSCYNSRRASLGTTFVCQMFWLAGYWHLKFSTSVLSYRFVSFWAFIFEWKILLVPTLIYTPMNAHKFNLSRFSRPSRGPNLKIFKISSSQFSKIFKFSSSQSFKLVKIPSWNFQDFKFSNFQGFQDFKIFNTLKIVKFSRFQELQHLKNDYYYSCMPYYIVDFVS